MIFLLKGDVARIGRTQRRNIALWMAEPELDPRGGPNGFIRVESDKYVYAGGNRPFRRRVDDEREF
jgi:hypothetical protein